MTTAASNTSFDFPPMKVAPPQSFEGFDLYPAVTIQATRARVDKFADVVEREDDLGVCLVAHFELDGMLIVFYQSALDDKDFWTVLVDMRGCVANALFPTRMGVAVVRSLSKGAIAPDWVNDDADTEYRSRRRKRAKDDTLAFKAFTTLADSSKSSKGGSQGLKRSIDSGSRYEDRMVANARTGMFLEDERPRLSGKLAAKAGRVAAKKAAAPIGRKRTSYSVKMSAKKTAMGGKTAAKDAASGKNAKRP